MLGVGFRYACPYCKLMPANSCHWWRLSHEQGLGGSASHGSWAMPCCGKAWLASTGNACRTFSPIQEDGT
eukprot:3780157-Lingulodinium_polyedra.AAC.1